MSAWSKLPRKILGVLDGFRDVRGGKRQACIAGAGERQGSGKPTKTGSTPAVVPGAAPALVKAGAGGYTIDDNDIIQIWLDNGDKNNDDPADKDNCYHGNGMFGTKCNPNSDSKLSHFFWLCDDFTTKHHLSPIPESWVSFQCYKWYIYLFI